MSEQAVESWDLGLSVCSAAHAAEVGDCEVKVGFHYPSSRAEFSARELICIFSDWEF